MRKKFGSIEVEVEPQGVTQSPITNDGRPCRKYAVTVSIGDDAITGPGHGSVAAYENDSPSADEMAELAVSEAESLVSAYDDEDEFWQMATEGLEPSEDRDKIERVLSMLRFVERNAVEIDAARLSITDAVEFVNN